MKCHFADCPVEATERVPGFGDYCPPHAERARRLARLIPSAAPATPDCEPDPTLPDFEPDPTLFDAEPESGPRPTAPSGEAGE